MVPFLPSVTYAKSIYLSFVYLPCPDSSFTSVMKSSGSSIRNRFLVRLVNFASTSFGGGEASGGLENGHLSDFRTSS